eukprot:gene4628-5070_t
MATHDKYDRQLRLWGAEGQKFLMQSSILLIHADAVGSETLKNLVLPGIKSFTILDDHCIDEADLGSNFFTIPEAKGKPRAEIVAQLLSEMNPEDVVAEARVANYRNVLQTDPEFFCKFDLIIASNLPATHLLPLADLCWERNVPLIALRSYGLIGSVRLQLRCHEVYDNKEERNSVDLCIKHPFPELANYFQSFNLDSLDSLEHSHMPYLAILYQALQRWQQETGSPHPSSFADKEKFKVMIKSMARDYNQELNFQEAVREAYRAYCDPELSQDMSTLLSEGYPEGGAFGCLVEALRVFVGQNGGRLPIAGTIPDMVATTDAFVRLQQLFRQKAQEDLRLFQQCLVEELRARDLPADVLSDDQIEGFCRRASSIAVLRTSSIADEVRQPRPLGALLEDESYSDPPQTPLVWYICLRAIDTFYEAYARYPGQKEENSNLQSDVDAVWTILARLAENYQIPLHLPVSEEEGVTDQSKSVLSPSHALEIVRFGAIEMHPISAIVGGITAQEAVKILTHQYLPLSNTYIFNGIAACGATYEL